MSKCYSARCQQDRKLIRKEFNKWTKNILLQIGLETISKNHLEFDVNSFNETDGDDEMPLDFNPDESCLFCITRQETSSNKKSSTDTFMIEDENSPLDLSLKSTSNFPSSTVFDVNKSDTLPMYNSNDYFPSNQMNFDYLSQTFPHLNLFSSSLPINNQYSSFEEHYLDQFTKHMAYLRMIQEIEFQRNTKKKSKETTNILNPTTILTDSGYMNQIIQEIMSKTLNNIFEEQIKQTPPPPPPPPPPKEENVFVKKSNSDDLKKQSKSKVHSSSNQRSKEIISNLDGKQIRPKRGQYRRYETEQLSKAVAAVLSNEMSVHKAGSFFGVPHSTLEYKVKERNSKVKTDLSSSPKKSDDSEQSQSKNSTQNSSPTEIQSDDEDIQLYIPIEN